MSSALALLVDLAMQLDLQGSQPEILHIHYKKLQYEAFLASLRVKQPILVMQATPASVSQISQKTTNKKKQRLREYKYWLLISMDATTATVLSEVDDIFRFKKKNSTESLSWWKDVFALLTGFGESLVKCCGASRLATER